MLNVEYHLYQYKRCENGHMIYSLSESPKGEHCSICGAAFLIKCPECGTLLSSSFQSPAYFGSGKPVNLPSRPGACTKCGKLFPWTLRDSSGAVMTDIEATSAVIRLCQRFHEVVKQLRIRREDRPTIDVEDEYDVQDLMHALLRTQFDDIRAEEWTPSYAGGAARVDFLIKPYMVLLEIKKTRAGLNAREIGNQLIEDIARYRQISGTKTLICFVYDPEERIHNPKGLITDLEHDKKIDLKVIIIPTK